MVGGGADGCGARLFRSIAELAILIRAPAINLAGRADRAAVMAASDRHGVTGDPHGAIHLELKIPSQNGLARAMALSISSRN